MTTHAPGDPGGLLDTAGMADLLLTSKEAVHTMRHRGLLPPAFKVGGRVLWSKAEVYAWLEGQRDAERDGVTA